MPWTYDIYRSSKRPELRLVVRRGTDLPQQITKNVWQLTGQETSISPIEAAEIQRTGFAISRARESKNIS
jgi:hypothetical protein